MTRLERDKSKLLDLKLRHRDLICLGRFADAVKIELKIVELQEKILIAEYTQPAAVGELLADDPKAVCDTIDRCIKLHIAADYVAKCALELEDYLKENGFNLKTFTPEFKQLAKDATRLASRLFRKRDMFEATIIDNDTLLAAIDKKVESYVEQRRVKGNKKESNNTTI